MTLAVRAARDTPAIGQDLGGVLATSRTTRPSRFGPPGIFVEPQWPLIPAAGAETNECGAKPQAGSTRSRCRRGSLGHHAASFTLDTYVHLLEDDIAEAPPALDDLFRGATAGQPNTQAAETLEGESVEIPVHKRFPSALPNRAETPGASLNPVV